MLFLVFMAGARRSRIGSRTDQGTSQTNPTEPPGCLHFHGTTLKAAVSMLQLGGFIPGKNGHCKRGKYLQGLFCADSLGEAFLRVNPCRALDSRGRLQLAGCPVVVELVAAHVREYHQERSDLHVMEGEPGKVLPGFRL